MIIVFSFLIFYNAFSYAVKMIFIKYFLGDIRAMFKRLTTIRIPDMLYEKLRYLAYSDKRSINAQIEYALNAFIEKYEQEHSEIIVPNSFLEQENDIFISKNQSRFSLRADNELMAKYKVIAKQNHKSLNKSIETLIEKEVEAYEKQHGEIQISEPYEKV